MQMVGEFIPTAKNKVAADMYPKLGFRKIGDTLFCAMEKPILRAHIRPALEGFLPVEEVPASILTGTERGPTL